jgi:hypothetical protein
MRKQEAESLKGKYLIFFSELLKNYPSLQIKGTHNAGKERKKSLKLVEKGKRN